MTSVTELGCAQQLADQYKPCAREPAGLNTTIRQPANYRQQLSREFGRDNHAKEEDIARDGGVEQANNFGRACDSDSTAT